MRSAYQLAAIDHRQGPAICVAGPGAGKTTVLVDRVASLLRDGARADRILCVTFSRDAAEEMRIRVAKITGLSEKTLRDSISTFHSLALRMLRAYQPQLITRPQVEKILREYIRKDRVYEQIAFNGRMRRALVSPEQAFQQSESVEKNLELAEVYGKYDETLREENLIDFDSMVYRAVESLQNGNAAEWEGKFKYVILDEGQDTDHGQMHLAKRLAGGNLMVVSDLSQEIYGFRGSDGKGILASMHESKHYFLPINYRSKSEIVEAFKPFAEQDELSHQLVSKMEASRGAGATVELHAFFDDFAEAEAVCQEIRESGLPSNAHAVLARTRALLLNYCEELERLGIPYDWRGKNFWASPEIEDAVAFARLAIDPTDRKAWYQAICSPAACAKYLGRKFASAVTASPVPALKLVPTGNWKEYELEQWREMRETVKSLGRIADSSPAEFLQGMMISAGLGVCDSQNEEPDDFRRENLNALVRRATRFTSLLEFVRHAEKMKRRTRSEARAVTLSTIHAAKGLEFQQVFVVGLTKDIIPHKRSEDFNEERRLAYVALSRAKDRLWMSYHGEKSVFVNYLPATIIEVSHVLTEKVTA